jgi:hypothetical protein
VALSDFEQLQAVHARATVLGQMQASSSQRLLGADALGDQQLFNEALDR